MEYRSRYVLDQLLNRTRCRTRGRRPIRSRGRLHQAGSSKIHRSAHRGCTRKEKANANRLSCSPRFARFEWTDCKSRIGRVQHVESQDRAIRQQCPSFLGIEVTLPDRRAMSTSTLPGPTLPLACPVYALRRIGHPVKPQMENHQ